jgi:hypothetical protein
MITGFVAYLHAWDIAYDLRRPGPAQLLGQRLVPQRLEVGKRAPRQMLFAQPLTATLPAVNRQGPHGPVAVSMAVRVLGVGALAIEVRVPFAVQRLEDLVVYHDLRFADGSLDSQMHELAGRALAELRPHLLRPVETLADEEAYTVFCLDPGVLAGAGAESWLAANRRPVAALLAQEDDPAVLAEAEVAESTSRWLSYYRDDLAVVDWDAALLIDDAPDLDDDLLILELANVELAELESYDRTLDAAVTSCYPDIGGSWIKSRSAVLRQLGEIGVDLARMRDELTNASKFHGEYHLARLHRLTAERFHLADWYRTVEDKQRTVDGIYQAFTHDRNNRWMLALEVAVVLLFIIDLFIIVHLG